CCSIALCKRECSLLQLLVRYRDCCTSRYGYVSESTGNTPGIIVAVDIAEGGVEGVRLRGPGVAISYREQHLLSLCHHCCNQCRQGAVVVSVPVNRCPGPGDARRRCGQYVRSTTYRPGAGQPEEKQVGAKRRLHLLLVHMLLKIMKP